mgnify:CR=1 FL=1
MAEMAQMPIFDGTVFVPVGIAEGIMDQLCMVGQASCIPDRETDETTVLRWERLKQHARFCKDCHAGLAAYKTASGA